MFKRDYLLQLIERLGMVLAQSKTLKEQGDFKQARETVNKAYKKLLKVNLDEMNEILNDQIVEKLTNKYQFDNTQLGVLAELLKEEGDIYYEEGDFEKVKARFYKSLIIFEYLNQAEQVYSFDREAKMVDMRQKIRLIEEI